MRTPKNFIDGLPLRGPNHIKFFEYLSPPNVGFSCKRVRRFAGLARLVRKHKA